MGILDQERTNYEKEQEMQRLIAAQEAAERERQAKLEKERIAQMAAEEERRRRAERDRQEAIYQRQLWEKAKYKRLTKNIFLLILGSLVSIIAGGMALYAYATLEMVTLFKLAFALEIVATIVLIVILAKPFANRQDLGIKGFKAIMILWIIVNIVAGGLMIGSGRLGIDSIVQDDNGIVYAEVKDNFYLYDCSNSDTTLVVSELSQEIAGIGKKAFKSNSVLTSVIVDVPTLKIDKNAFQGCTALTTVKFVGGDYTLEKGAFQKCKNLTSVIFENGNYNFKGANIFDGCSHLTDIYMNGGNYKGAPLVKLLAGVGKVAVHHNNAEIDVKLTGADELTLVVYPETNTIFKIKPDVLVFANGYDFGTWIDGNNGSIKPFAPKIYLPYTITNVPDGIFGSDSTSYNVYYQGSEWMWEDVNIPGLDGWIFGSNSNYSRDFTKMHFGADCKYWETNNSELESMQ